MARRVNTNFVITLSVVLVAAAGVVAAGYVTLYRRQHDPVGLEKRAQDAAKAGNVAAEIQNYQLALNECVRRGMNTGDPGVGTMSLALGNVFYDTSTGDPGRFAAAMNCWHDALVADPSLSEAVSRLLTENYNLAEQRPSIAGWQTVLDLANRALKNNAHDTDALRYRAMANLALSHAKDITDQQLTGIGADVAAAEKLAHDDIDALNLQVDYASLTAAVARQRGQADTEQNIRKQTRALIAKYIERHPKEAEAYLTLANFSAKSGDIPGAKTALASALAEEPDNIKVIRFAAHFYFVINDRDNAEKMAHRLVDINGASALDAEFAGSMFSDWGRPGDAIPMFQKAIADKQFSKGVTGKLDQEATIEAMFDLCLAYLEQARQLGPTTPKGQEAFASAKDEVTKFRAIQANNPILYFLDGYIALVDGQTLTAIEQLRKADDYFTGAKQQSNPNAQRVKSLLAEAYVATGDTGLALEKLDEYVSVPPYEQVLAVQFHRAQLQLATMKIDDAVHTSDMLIAARPDDPSIVTLRAKILQRAGRGPEAAALLTKLNNAHPDTSSGTQLATMQLANQDAASAVTTLTPVLKKDPDNIQAISIMAQALVQLDRKDDAKQLVQAAHDRNPSDVHLAVLQSQLDHPESTLKQLIDQVNQQSNDPFANAMRLAGFYRAQHDLPHELSSLQDAEKLKPDEQAVIDGIFENAIARKDKDLAQRYVQRAQALNLDGVNGIFYVGRYEYQFGDKDKALDMLQRAVNDRPDYSTGWTYYGLALADSNKPKEAIDALNKAVDERPDNLQALRTLVLLYLGQGGEASRRLAAERLEAALRFAPNDPQLRNFNDLLGNPQKAIANREAIRAANPKDEDNLFRLAVLYSQNGKAAKAIEILQPVAARHPDGIQIADALAKMYRQNHQVNEALKTYEPFLLSKDDKIKLQALLMYADMEVSLNQDREAVSTLEQAVPLDPHVAALQALANLKTEMGDLAGAEPLLRKINDKAPNPDVVRRLVSVLIDESKFAEADDLLVNNILKNNPSDPVGLTLRGASYFQQHKPKEALDALNTVLDANNDNTDALFYRARVYDLLLNDRDRAIADLTHIRSLQPGRIDARLLLAQIYRADHQYAEAAGEYQAILSPDMQPDNVRVRLEYAQLLFALCQQAIQLSPDNPSIEAASVRAAKPFDTLSALLQESVARYPQQPIWPTMVGQYQTLTGQSDAAIATLSNVYERFKEPSTGLALIDVYEGNHHNDQALALIDQMLVANPEAPELYAKRGVALTNQDRIPEAITVFNKGLDLAAALKTNALPVSLSIMQQMQAKLPADQTLAVLKKRLAANDNPVTRISLGQYEAIVGDYADTVQLLTPLMSDKDAPYHFALLQILAPSEQQTHTPQGLQAAEDHYKELIAHNPNDMQTVNNLAYLLAQDIGVGENNKAAIAEAQTYADRAAALLDAQGSDHFFVAANVLDTVGWVRFLGGNYDQSLESLNHSINLQPLPVAYYHRAKVYEKQAKMDDARDDAKTAVKMAHKTNDAIQTEAQNLLDSLSKVSVTR